MSLVLDYKLGIKREVSSALEQVFKDAYPDEQLRNRVFVGTEFPLREVEYPAIYITYSEGELRNAGIGHYEVAETEDGGIQKILHWLFTGQLNFNILAKTTMDREMLAAGFLNTVAFGKQMSALRIFHEELDDNDWVAITLLTEKINAGGESTETAPWSANERIYTTSYSIGAMGEFWTEPTTSDLIRISKINLYPYRSTDQDVPTGSNDPAPWV